MNFKKDVKVELITSDDIKGITKENQNIANEFIEQYQVVDKKGEEIRNKRIKILKVLNFLIFLIPIIFFISYLILESKLIFISIIPFIYLIYSSKILKRKIKNQVVYTYKYSKKFPFKVCLSYHKTKQNSDTFIHGKVYLIDDKIAYLGSLNFTSSGTKYNYETRIRTTDSCVIDKLKKEFSSMMVDSNLREKDI